jgi:ketosteroid isomerase-like protein
MLAEGPMSTSESNLALVREYLSALERFASADELQDFFHADVVLEEMPNALVPGGATRNLEEILRAGQAGRRKLQKQTFEIRNEIADDWRVAVEVKWEGTLRTGGVMRASFAMFVEIRNGKIAVQRNYDCFEPF